MTQHERFLAFANFGPVDRVLRYAKFSGALLEVLTDALGKDPYQHFLMDSPVVLRPQLPPDIPPPDYASYYPDYEDGKDGFFIDKKGCGQLKMGFHHFSRRISPLENANTLQDIEDFPIGDYSQYEPPEMAETCRRAHEEGRIVRGQVGHMYEDAWQIRGYEPFLEDLMLQRDWAELLLEKICNNNVGFARTAAKAGCDYIACGDDVANQNTMMFHPDLWREVMKPRWARVFAAAKAEKPDIQVWYHSDGDITDILDDLIEIGVTILNPVQPECMDPVAIRKRYGRSLAFDGCIGTQTTFPFGSVEDMHRTVTDLAEALKWKEGGLMLSPTHVLEPEVPPENIIAFFKACEALSVKA